MNRLVVVASMIGCALVAAACGSDSTGPKDTFAGTWVGVANTTTITVTATQNGSTVSGTGTAVNSPNSFTLVVTGTSTPPNVTLAITASDSEHLTFDGTYVTADSVAGMLHEGSDSIAFGVKKQ
jgi:hypothetical protein